MWSKLERWKLVGAHADPLPRVVRSTHLERVGVGDVNLCIAGVRGRRSRGRDGEPTVAPHRTRPSVAVQRDGSSNNSRWSGDARRAHRRGDPWSHPRRGRNITHDRAQCRHRPRRVHTPRARDNAGTSASPGECHVFALFLAKTLGQKRVVSFSEMPVTRAPHRRRQNPTTHDGLLGSKSRAQEVDAVRASP